MIFPFTALGQARRQALGLVLGSARVGTELAAQLVVASVRATCAVWTRLLDVPTRPGAPDPERTAEGGSGVPRPAADSTEPGPRPQPDADRTTERGTRAEAAPTARPSSPDLVPAEPVSADLAPADQPTIDQWAPDQSLARTTPAAGTVDVTFRVPGVVGARSAHVCGEFNDWSTTADPMDRRDDGSFELVRALPVGRGWRFRYLLDGDRWENDRAADDYLPNDFGDHDSVVDLRTPSASRLVSAPRPPDEQDGT